MKSSDKVLIGIVVGVVLIVAVALVVTLTRPGPAYQADGTPEATVFNYIFALQREDYARAYSYLSPTVDGYPSSATAFHRELEDWDNAYSWDEVRFDLQSSYSVYSEAITGKTATVNVRSYTTYGSSALDRYSSSSIDTFSLALENGRWMVVDIKVCWGSCCGASQYSCGYYD